MNLFAWLLAVVLSALAAGGGGLWVGQDVGRTAEAAKRDAQNLKDLGSMLDAQKGLIDQANAASLAMRQATAKRLAADRKTTEDITHALALTAGDRAGCHFPDDSMRQLAQAHRRAAEAAASGVRGALPAATATPGGN